MRCEHCHWDYPQDLLAHLRKFVIVCEGADLYNNLKVCGLCGLKIYNQEKKTHQKHFSQVDLEGLRLGALAWRRRAPYCMPRDMVT